MLAVRAAAGVPLMREISQVRIWEARTTAALKCRPAMIHRIRDHELAFEASVAPLHRKVGAGWKRTHQLHRRAALVACSRWRLLLVVVMHALAATSSNRPDAIRRNT
jgi:hypothetical protein